MDKRILLVGFGNMGQALVNGWLAQGRQAASIGVVDPHPDARRAAAALGVAAAADCRGVAADYAADVIVLAVKPAQVAEALTQCRGLLRPGAVLLSIVAGKTLPQLAALAGGGAAVVRAMPNTPAAIGRGVSVLCAGAATAEAQRALCGQLMAAVGGVEWLDDEALMDAVTAVSGSGPAYVFLLIECLARAARQAGLDEPLASRLATATVAGAGAYAEQSGLDAAELRRRVTSPKGTTAAALQVLLSEDGLAEILGKAVQAAANRSRELSAE